MLEKLPPFGRPEPTIVGSAPHEKKNEIKKTILERFGEKHLEQTPESWKHIVEALEYDKKPYEKEAIKQINEITNALLKEAGVSPFDVPECNIRIVPQSIYKDVETDVDCPAITTHDSQAIVLNAEKLTFPASRVSVLLHEITHLKGFLSFEARGDEDSPRRIGLRTYSSKLTEDEVGSFWMFSGLNEAVVADIEKEYTPKILNENKYLNKEMAWQNSNEAKSLKEKVAQEQEIDADDVIWVNEDGSNYSVYSYYYQRQVLNQVTNRIYFDNSEEFESPAEIKRLFRKALFSGRMLEIARLVEKSFGKGSFRVLGTMTEDRNSARAAMNYFSKKRAPKN